MAFKECLRRHHQILISHSLIPNPPQDLIPPIIYIFLIGGERGGSEVFEIAICSREIYIRNNRIQSSTNQSSHPPKHIIISGDCEGPLLHISFPEILIGCLSRRMGIGYCSSRGDCCCSSREQIFTGRFCDRIACICGDKLSSVSIDLQIGCLRSPSFEQLNRSDLWSIWSGGTHIITLL